MTSLILLIASIVGFLWASRMLTAEERRPFWKQHTVWYLAYTLVLFTSAIGFVAIVLGVLFYGERF